MIVRHALIKYGQVVDIEVTLDFSVPGVDMALPSSGRNIDDYDDATLAALDGELCLLTARFGLVELASPAGARFDVALVASSKYAYR